MIATWKTVADADVRQVWCCGDQDCLEVGKETLADPFFYEENGVPICGSCGQDMCYVRTEVCS
jgi:hypothetical protein